MSCRICGAQFCAVFHTVEERDNAAEKAHSISTLLSEIESLKAQIKERDEKIEELRSDIRIQEERIIDLEDMI